MTPLDGGDTEIVKALSEKEAVTDIAELTLMGQVRAVPEQPPDHPENEESAPGNALSVTNVPLRKRVPAGLLLTVPCPSPDFLIVTAYSTASGLPF